MANTPFITAKDARDAFDQSRKWYRPYDEQIEELERLQRGRPSPRIDPSLPRVTDGTLAAINQETGKRIVQQVPTGLVVSKERPEFAALGNYLITNKLIPLSCRMGSEIQKAWALITKAGGVGSATCYSYFTSVNGQMYAEWILPYVKDIYGEKGKPFMPDSNLRFMRSWYQKSDIKAIIAKEKALQERSKGYTSDWDLRMLSDLLNSDMTRKDSDVMTPAEREKGGDSGGYEIIHAFQNGKEAEFYSFSPRFKDGDVFRRKTNRDPRGKMPLDDMYWNIDHSNPRGRGQIELSGGIQNVMDQQLQGFVFDSVYNQQPALIVNGPVNKASLKIKTNAIWDAGRDGKIIRDQIDNTSIQNFVSNSQYLQSKIYNMNSSQDNSIGAASGDVNQSKTQAGVQASQARLGTADNYVRKQFEEAWGNMTETRVNIYLSEMTGTATMKLDGDDLDTIRKSEAAQFLDEKGTLTIPYKQIEKMAFEFQVDASSSEIKADADNAEKLTEVYKLISQDLDPAIASKKMQVLKLLIDEIGAEGTDDLFPELNQKDENGMPVEQQAPQGPDPQMIQQMVQETVQQAMKAQEKPLHESLGIKFEMLPEDVQQKLIEQIFNIQAEAPTPSAVATDQAQQKIDLEAQKHQTSTMLQADKQAHDTQLAIAKHEHEGEQSQFNNYQADRQQTASEEQAKVAAKQKQPVGAGK